MYRVAASIVAASLTAGLAHGTIHYDVTDYGRPSFFTALIPYGVDNAGRVVSAGGFGVLESYLFSADGIQPLGGPTSGFAFVNAINDKGSLAGMYYDSSLVPSRAAIWDLSGAVKTLDLLANTVAAQANDINDSNEAVGFAYPTFSSQIAIHWTADGSAHVLPGIGSVVPTSANVITDSGTIYGTGKADTDGDGFLDTEHVLRWTGGVAQDLGAMECGVAAATDAGAVLCNGLGTPAYILDGGGTHLLELLQGATRNSAFDMSETGVVTGYSSLPAGPDVPTVWIDGTPLRLNDLVDPAWRVDAVGAINDKGEIGAWAAPIGGGRPHTVLLTPREDNTVPTPGTLGLVLGCLGLLSLRCVNRPHVAKRVAAR